MSTMPSLDSYWKNFYSEKRFVHCPYDQLASFVYRYAPRKPRGEVRIMEAGCGPANNLWFFAHEGFNVAGFDAEEAAIDHGRRRIASDGLEADLRVAAFPEVPFASESFDLVMERAALSCVAFDVARETIAEIRRVLKPGGKFCFTPYTRHSAFHGFLEFYTPAKAEEILSVGWKILEMKQASFDDLRAGANIYGELRVVAERVE